MTCALENPASQWGLRTRQDPAGQHKAPDPLRGIAMRERHLSWCVDRGLRPNTIAAKRGALQRFARTIAPVLPEDASADDVRVWYETVGGMAQHRHCELSHIRQFFQWLQRIGHRPDDPTLHLMAPKIRRRLPRPISDGDLRLALQHAADPVKSWFLFGALAGLRSCEIAPIRVDDLLLDQANPMLYVADGKGGRDRTVPLHPTLANLPIPMSGYLWPDNGTHVTAKRVMRSMNAHLRGLGIRATGHQLRHRFASKFYEASGCDLRATQEVMGHLNPATTALYTVWSMDRASVAVSQIGI